MSMKKNAFRLTLMALGTMLGAASVAWACTAQTSLYLPTASGPSGGQVTVNGQSAPAGQPVEIFWNNLSGAKLATATADSAGNFSAEVTIPATEPGLHFIMAQSKADQASPARAIFTVGAAGTESVTSKASADLWTGFAKAQGSTSGSEGLSGSKQGGLPLGAGIALLSIGALALGSVAVIVPIRRRQTAAGR